MFNAPRTVSRSSDDSISTSSQEDGAKSGYDTVGAAPILRAQRPSQVTQLLWSYGAGQHIAGARTGTDTGYSEIMISDNESSDTSLGQDCAYRTQRMQRVLEQLNAIVPRLDVRSSELELMEGMVQYLKTLLP